MFSRHDLGGLAEILRVAARSEVMPRFRRLAADHVRTKSGPLDLVTDADEAAERAIAAALQARFPGCLVVGEEAASADPSLIDGLAAAPLAFTVDPIDGTANYAAGLPLFGMMAAVVEHGATVGAVILDPVVDSYSAALRDEGAWEQAADGGRQRLRVALPAALQAMAGPVSWRFMPAALRDRVLTRLPRLAAVWDHRCAAHEYRALVAGHAHFVLFNKLLPWDHLPGVLLHREAGGYAAKFDGSAYVPGDVSGGLICAPDQGCWHAIRTALLLEDATHDTI